MFGVLFGVLFGVRAPDIDWSCRPDEMAVATQ
jgi:hypothetical protein